MAPIVYLSGRFCPLEEALVPITDRGLLFGDGIYEVYRVYAGRPFRLKEHLERLRRSAAAVRLALPEIDWFSLHAELSSCNGLQDADATVYIEVTRGAPASRGHAFPAAGTPPTVFVVARPFTPPAPALYEAGVDVITRPDIRWGRCDIKSVNLLANVLANQDAVEAGAWETVFRRDDVLTEGTHTNVFAVADAVITTHPEGPRILSGVTRSAVIETAQAEGFVVREEPIPVAALERATEVFLTGTSAEVMPVSRVDGRTIGTGRPGPVAVRLRGVFRRLT